ncbi:MAG: hypothetical protein SVV67_03540 [Bacillota bacterium]|nr:hypothetical protein [Bacillota bacterium]
MNRKNIVDVLIHTPVSIAVVYPLVAVVVAMFFVSYPLMLLMICMKLN